MEYRSGRIGRCFVTRFDHGDAVLEGLCELAKREQVRSAL
jgi:predicted DNA-binding protein with PD1-like motif